MYFNRSIFFTDIENLQLEDFVKWLSGTREVPPLGYPKKLSAQFVHGCPENCQCRPTVSTCDLSINLPVHINNEGIMKEILYSAIKDSYGFGNL